MGFFFLGPEIVTTNKDPLKGVRAELLNEGGCSVCPLNTIKGLRNPRMEPSGTKKPLVYMLGVAPDQETDRSGRHFDGNASEVLRERIPADWRGRIRYGNTIRCCPPNKREPSPVEVECCRRYSVTDIEQTKPFAIFGFGNGVLQWLIKQTGIVKWRGRYMPVRVGKHVCWFFPMESPYEIYDNRRYQPRSSQEYGSDNEFAFARDLRNAFKMVDTLPDPKVHTQEHAEDSVEWVTGRDSGDMQRVLKWLKHCASQPYAGLDYETNAVRPYAQIAKILSVALSTKQGTLAFPLHHRESGWSKANLKTVNDAFHDFLYDPNCRKISHNLAFEAEWSGWFYGKECLRESPWGDSMAQAYVLDDRVKMSKPDALSLQVLCLQHFGIDIKALSPLDRANLDKAPLEDVLRYNGIDAKYHRLLFQKQLPLLKADGTLQTYERHIPRTIVAVLTQLKGVPADRTVVKELESKYRERTDRIAAEIQKLPTAKRYHKLYGKPYNPGAPADGLKLFTMLGKRATNADEKAFKGLKDPIAGKTIEWRKANKVLSTYITPLAVETDSIVFPDDRMHPNLATCATRTSRTASDDPNIQNWPKRQGESTEVRRQVRPPRPGYKIASIDYSAIQARNVAMESKDRRLVQSFWDHIDTHSNWMERIVKVYPDWLKGQSLKDKNVAKEFRQLAKNQFVFPSFFGAAGKSVAGGLGIPQNKGEILHEQFWDEFPDILRWHKKLHQDYRKLAYVTGLAGYRRRAPVAHTEIINTPIQADEAIIVTDAMDRLSLEDGDLLQPIMMVHDSLEFEWPANRVDELADKAINIMCNVPFKWAHIVPIGVEFAIGDDWYSLKEVGKFESVKGGGYRQL